MNIVKKIVVDVLIAVWFIVAFFTTVCLLSYNDFGTTVLGKNTLLIMDSDELEPKYNEGDLVIVKRVSDNKINVGDEVFYYNSAMNSNVLVFLGDIEEKQEVSKTDTTYTIEGEKVSGEFIVGPTSNAKVYPKLGKVLGIITSKWGFMFIILFPMLFAVIYEVMMIITAVKNGKKEIEE